MSELAALRSAIRHELGYAAEDDMRAAQALRALLPSRHGFRYVGEELKNRAQAIVVGCAQSLDTLEPATLPQGIVIAADGATGRLRELGITPRVVVTDLDGAEEDLRWAADAGAIMVVHAHGDNMDRLPLVEELGPFVAGTHQCAPQDLSPLRDVGGFTDGDRAVALALSMGVKRVHLVAFDTEAPPSTWSGRVSDHKAQKLAWAKRILDELAQQHPGQITQ